MTMTMTLVSTMPLRQPCRITCTSVSVVMLLSLLVTNLGVTYGQTATSSIPPYWARETQLHQDTMDGVIQGGEFESLAIPYDVQVPPGFLYEGDPDIKVGLNIFKIKEIDITTSRMQINAWIRMSWIDPRLAWDPTNPAYLNVTQTTYNADTNPEVTEIWVPDLELVNQDAPLVESFQPKQALAYPDGSVFWSRVGSLNALCAFSGIRRHPFDENECTLEFSGWSRSALFANYSFMDPPLTWGGTGTARTTYQEYNLNQEKARANVNTFFFDCCPSEPWPTLTYTIAFERTTTALYLRTLTVPVMLLTFLASAVFWFDVRCGERLGYGITVLLAITAVEIIAEESLPTCPEWLWVEAFTVGSFVISVICLLESCVVTHLYFKQRKEDLTEWMRVGDEKKDEDDSDGHQSLSYFSCEGRGVPSMREEKSLRALSLNGDKTRDDVEEPSSSSLTDKVKRSFVIPKKMIKKAKKQKEDMTNLERWAAERDLDPEKFNQVRRIDAWSFRAFLLVYVSFIVVMFASLPLWSDDYQVNL